MKKIIALLAVLAAVLLPSACSPDKPADKATDPPTERATGYASSVWEGVSGRYTRGDSGQPDSSVLQMKYLDNGCVMFEFRLSRVGGDAPEAIDTVVSGVLVVDEDGTGRFETDPGAEKPFTLSFTLSNDGQQVTVAHGGEMSIAPDGVYGYTDGSLEVTDTSAVWLLEFLPTAATSLNSVNGAYTLHYPEGLIADWFYPVQAESEVNGAVLAKFLIAKDMSAVFRVDDDIEPALIFGSAQTMLEAHTLPLPMDGKAEELGEDEAASELFYEPRPVAWVALENGVVMAPGESDRLIAVLPWELPYSITAQSSDSGVVRVDENGAVTALSPGEAVLSGTLVVADGETKFSITLDVTDASGQGVVRAEG